MDLSNHEMTFVGPATLPKIDEFPKSVTDGNFIYLLGGYSRFEGYPTHGIVQFDPDTYNNKFLPVQNMEASISYRRSPGGVYIPSSKRIYYFGGEAYNTSTFLYKTLDDIFYIDLTPVQPPTTATTEVSTSTTPNPDFFSCSNRTNGNEIKQLNSFYRLP